MYVCIFVFFYVSYASGRIAKYFSGFFFFLNLTLYLGEPSIQYVWICFILLKNCIMFHCWIASSCIQSPIMNIQIVSTLLMFKKMPFLTSQQWHYWVKGFLTLGAIVACSQSPLQCKRVHVPTLLITQFAITVLEFCQSHK